MKISGKVEMDRKSGDLSSEMGNHPRDGIIRGSGIGSCSAGSEMKPDGARSSESESESGLETGSSGRMRGFDLGDMVWGKVKSHPWWPGHIFNEALASRVVSRSKVDGQVLVAFFGDSSYGWFETDELIPFDSHFPEKSRQTSARNFPTAVGEAVDEVSRRAALALACRCRNPNNFRPTPVPRHFSVDVIGYEPGGVYSLDQIRKSRDRFVPSETISFIRQLAVTPQKIEPFKSLAWLRGMATLIAYRRAVFEEFDETYAQAFGAEPVRPVKNEADQPERFAPRAAPLSGPLVIAEALGKKKIPAKSSIKSTSKAPSSPKKNNYLFRRRDETPLPDLRPVRHHAEHSSDPAAGQHPSSPVVISEASPPAGNYLLQKRPPPTENPEPKLEKLELADPVSPDTLPASDPRDTRPRLGKEDSDEWITRTPPHDASVKKEKVPKPPVVARTPPHEASVKKEKIPKPPVDASVDKKKKRKTRTDEFQSKHTVISNDGVGKSSNLVFPVKLELNSPEFKLAEHLSDLSDLAMDPFHGTERGTPDIVRHIFLRFRSLVYQKSLPSIGETDDAYDSTPNPDATIDVIVPTLNPDTFIPPVIELEERSQSKPSKLISRPDDPTKAGRKRSPSDRQEEMSAKRLKKLDHVKKKLTGIVPKESQQQQKMQLDHQVAEPVKKQEEPPAPRVPTPTFLVLRFPPMTTLPSIATLKVRFGRFGPLDLPETRVYWKSHSCKVLFKHRADALSAYGHATSNDLFGQVRVSYSIRETDGTAADVVSLPKSVKQQSNPNPRLLAQPKSILKKPGDEGCGSVKPSPRVTFMLGGENDRRREGKVVSNGNGGGGGGVVKPLDPISKHPRSVNFVRPPPPPPPPPGFSQPPSARYAEVWRGGQEAVERRGKGEDDVEGKGVDVSYRMLSLLLRCSEIVLDVKSSLGYVPYHPL